MTKGTREKQSGDGGQPGEKKKTGHRRGQQTQMVGRGSRQTDRRVKGLQVRQKEGRGGRRGEGRKWRRRKMSAVAFVAPSGDVMFATSLGLSGHPSPLPPPSIQRCSSLLVSLSLHTFQLSRQQSAMFVITSGYTRPGLSISRPSVLKEFWEVLKFG